MRIEKILTTRELTIDLSIPAMEAIVHEISRGTAFAKVEGSVYTEVLNFKNLLLNLIERGVDKVDNSDLI